MNTSRKLFAGVVLAGLTFARPAGAEVAAETDAFGTYVRTVIYANGSAHHPRIWSASRARFGLTPLNPRGDVSGDLMPVVVENPTQNRWPWAVWSRFNGHDYDLVWSRWQGRSWSPIAAVEPEPSPLDAVDPAMTFDTQGRAHMVWLGRDDGSSSVYLSIFLVSRWMAPLRVSEPGEFATNPAIAVLADGSILAGYDTPAGRVVKTVRLARTDTITDDLNPFGPTNSSATANADLGPGIGNK